MDELPERSWRTIRQDADQARLGAAHDQAIALYSEALCQPGVTWPAQHAMRIERAYCWFALGRFSDMDGDLTELAAQSLAAGDDGALVITLAQLVINLRLEGGLARCTELAQQAVRAAQRTGDPLLQVEALYALGIVQTDTADLVQAQATLAAAEAFYSQVDALSRIKVHFFRGYLMLRLGNLQQAHFSAEIALQTARAEHWRIWEGHSLNLLSNVEPDLARQGLLLEQNLDVWVEVGHKPNQCVALCNLSQWYLTFGLYGRAAKLAEDAWQVAQTLKLTTQGPYVFQTLGKVASAGGDLATALRCLAEGAALAHKADNFFMQGSLLVEQASMLLCEHKEDAALELLSLAGQLLMPEPHLYTASRLACAALAHAQRGEKSMARSLAAQVAEMITPADFGTPEWALDEVYWWCYCALTRSEDGDADGPLGEERWRLLEAAQQALMLPVSQLSDTGLRRGYLHRAAYRRLVIRQWLKWAPVYAQAESVAAYLELVRGGGRNAEIFRRLLAVGIHINAHHGSERLPTLILDAVAELTGAERTALVLGSVGEPNRTVEVRLPLPPHAPIDGGAGPRAGSADQERAAFLAEIEPWLAEAEGLRGGFVRVINADADFADQRSVLAVPLLRQGKVFGSIYCDLAGCFGRFEREDLDLAGILANQAAVALENLEWASTLEKKVAERTAEVEAARCAAENATASKGALLATMSHEIRTPLNAIIGMSALLMDTQLSSEQQDFASTIHNSSDTLLALINDILDSAKLEAGKMELDLQPFDLAANIHTTVDIVKHKASEKKIRLSCCLADNLPAVIIGDATRLRQVLLNLLSNAVKFTQAGEVSVKVECLTALPAAVGSATSPDLVLHFCVRDTGIGVHPHLLGRLFQPFHQADPTTAGRFGGTGLGLSISRALVELMGGSISVESSGVPGEGSLFQFTMAARLVAEPAALEPAAAEPAQRLPLRPLRILVAEDNLVNQRVILAMLKKLGQGADVVGDGLAALAALTAQPYDVVLMDMEMPELDGLGATQAVRDPASAVLDHTIPIVALTAHAMQGDRERFLSAGIDDYVAKPIRIEDLLSALQRVAEQASAEQA